MSNLTLNEQLCQACRDGDKAQVLSLIKQGANDWENGLYYSGKMGHEEIQLIMISKMKYVNKDLNKHSLNVELRDACHNGNKETVLSLIKEGADDFNGGLTQTCLRGYKDLALLMIEHGANNFNVGLSQACFTGHVDLVNLMIENGATDWEQGLYYAKEGGHTELVNLMINKMNEYEKKLEIPVTREHNYLEDLLKQTKCVIMESDYNTPQITLLKPGNEKAIYEDIMSQFKNLDTNYVKSVTFQIIGNKYVIDILKDKNKVDKINYTVFGYDGEYLKSFFLLDELLKTKYTKSRDNSFFMLK